MKTLQLNALRLSEMINQALNDDDRPYVIYNDDSGFFINHAPKEFYTTICDVRDLDIPDSSRGYYEIAHWLYESKLANEFDLID